MDICSCPFKMIERWISDIFINLLLLNLRKQTKQFDFFKLFFFSPFRDPLQFSLTVYNTFPWDAIYKRCIILIDNPLGHDITDTVQQFNNESRAFIAKYSYDLPHYNAFRFH